MALTAVSQKSTLILKYILEAFQNKITDFEKIYVNINRKKLSNIISNDRSFECPIIYTYTIHNGFFLIDTSTMLKTKKGHSLIRKPYLAIINSNVLEKYFRFPEKLAIC